MQRKKFTLWCVHKRPLYLKAILGIIAAAKTEAGLRPFRKLGMHSQFQFTFWNWRESGTGTELECQSHFHKRTLSKIFDLMCYRLRVKCYKLYRFKLTKWMQGLYMFLMVWILIVCLLLLLLFFFSNLSLSTVLSITTFSWIWLKQHFPECYARLRFIT